MKLLSNDVSGVDVCAKFALTFFFWLELAGLTGCQTIRGDLPGAADIPASPGAIRYQVQPGDILDMHFSDSSLDQQILVNPDGEVNITSSKDIVAAGLSLTQLRDRIKADAKIVDLSFDIALRSSVGIRVYVTGEVATPGEIIATGQISAVQAVSRAGGLKLGAQGTEMVLIRHDSSNKAKVYAVNFDAAVNGKDPKQDVWLQPYDILYVPRDRFGNLSLVFERLRNAIPIVFSLVYGSSNADF